MATATLDDVERRATATRDRAQSGAVPSEAEVNKVYEKGQVRRGISAWAAAPLSRVFAFGGHNAAQNALKKQYGLNERQARTSERAGGFRRAVGIVGGVSAVSTLIGGAVALSAVSLGVGAVGLAAAIAVKKWGNHRRATVTQQNIAQARGQTVPGSTNVASIGRRKAQAVSMRTAGTPGRTGSGGGLRAA
ncbi:MAG: hypothetical protein ACRD3Q_01130 [Terriglobales bacterium]